MIIQKSILLVIILFNSSVAFGQTGNYMQSVSNNIFSPNRVHITAGVFEKELNLQKERLKEINRRLAYAPDAETAARLRNEANNIRFGSYEIQLRDAAGKAALGDPISMAQLATAAGVTYAQTTSGFVVVQPTANQQWAAAGPPMSRENFVNYLYILIFGAY